MPSAITVVDDKNVDEGFDDGIGVGTGELSPGEVGEVT
jgi:hypothetical protein